MRRGEGEEFEGVIGGTDGQAEKDKIGGTVAQCRILFFVRAEMKTISFCTLRTRLDKGEMCPVMAEFNHDSFLRWQKRGSCAVLVRKRGQRGRDGR